MPYVICVVETTSVVHVMVAEVVLRAATVTALITGAPTAVVLKVKFGEVVAMPEPFVERAAKLYVVPGVRPVNVAECVAVRVKFGVVESP